MTIVFFFISLACAIVFPILYTLTSKWWKNPVGWLMMGLWLVIDVIYATRIIIATTSLRDYVDTQTVTMFSSGLVSLFLLSFITVYVYVLRVSKRRGDK